MTYFKRFMAAFEGFSGAHGQTQISNERRAGKQKAKSFIVRKPLTEELIQEHLNGINGVGAEETTPNPSQDEKGHAEFNAASRRIAGA